MNSTPLLLHLCIILWNSVTVSSSYYSFSKQECEACVSESCTYCKGEKFFDNPSICVCDDVNAGFFGSCSDFSFGADPFETTKDCQFNSKNGDIMFLAIIIVPTILAFCLLAICFFRLRNHSKGAGTSSGPGSNPAPYSEGLFGNQYQTGATQMPPSSAPTYSSINMPVATPVFASVPMSTGASNNTNESSAFDKLSAAL